MEKYNYREAMKKDIKEYLEYEKILETYEGTELEADLNDMLWDEDSITGNGAWGYTTESIELEEYISGNLSLAYEALENFCEDFTTLPNNFDKLLRYVDTTIRCYILSECIHDVLVELGVYQ